MTTPSTNKCQPDEMVYTSNPPQYRCKNCHQFWFCKDPYPSCHKPTEPSVCDGKIYSALNRGRARLCGEPKPCPLHEPSEVRIKPGEGKIIDGDSFTLTQDGDDLIATPQQEEASWEERLKCVGCCQGDYCAGKAGEHDEELKSFLRTEIAQAEKRVLDKAVDIVRAKWKDLYGNDIDDDLTTILAALKAKTDE